MFDAEGEGEGHRMVQQELLYRNEAYKIGVDGPSLASVKVDTKTQVESFSHLRLQERVQGFVLFDDNSPGQWYYFSKDSDDYYRCKCKPTCECFRNGTRLIDVSVESAENFSEDLNLTYDYINESSENVRRTTVVFEEYKKTISIWFQDVTGEFGEYRFVVDQEKSQLECCRSDNPCHMKNARVTYTELKDRRIARVIQ